jgi:hypothetical protein
MRASPEQLKKAMKLKQAGVRERRKIIVEMVQTLMPSSMMSGAIALDVGVDQERNGRDVRRPRGAGAPSA